MISSPRRPLSPTALALATLVLLAGACADPPATSDSDSASSSGSSGASETTPTSEPTGSATDDTGPPALGEARYFLRIDDDPVPPVRLEMDRAKVLEVFGEAATKNIKLLDVNSDILLADVLSRIQSSCGTSWDDYVNTVNDEPLPQDPKHDCTTTELGQTYGPGWKTSPQYAMVRLLTMTPRNGNVAGTALGPLWTYFHDPKKHNNAFGLSFEDLLAASLFCEGDLDLCVDQLNSFNQEQGKPYADKALEKVLQTTPFIPLDVLAATLKTTLMQSHPNINNPDGLLPVTLYDALYDMKPLADKFGPFGAPGDIDYHAGLLMHDDADGDGVDEFTTRSDALTADFKMAAIADSNLRLVEGVDASQGAGSMFISSDPASPLAFDFLDEKKVQLLGIAPNPIVDMRMRIAESPDFIPSCDGSQGDGPTACKTNLPDAPLGDKYIWSQPLWSLERIVAQAAYSTYKDRAFDYCFIEGAPCDAQVSIGPDPAGWSIFAVKVGVTVPPPQFFWEMLLGVAQIAVHDFTGPDTKDVDKDLNKTEILPAADGKPEIAEGDANPIFALKSLPIGLTAEEMIAQIRPNLQDQAAYIANIILGKYWKHNGALDFYYRRAAPDAPPVLFFVNKDDPRPDASGESLLAYNYDKVGFFSDEQLTTKVSATQIDGVSETAHEKYRLPEGETVLYMQDDEQKAYRLRFFVPKSSDPTEIVVHVHAL